jgi:hypothetical protein
MTDLQSHINIFKALGFIEHRNNLIRIVWHIATEHAEETSLEDFIKAISLATTTNTVEPIKEK